MKVIGACVAILLVFEGVIRFLIGVPRMEYLPLLRVQPDPKFGYAPVPGDQHYGYDEFITLNSLGLRGAEVSSKGPDEYRMLVFGGTQVYGLGIPDAGLFTNVLEDHLNHDDHVRTYRVMNFGVRAFSLQQQLNFLEMVGVAVEPDHVMVVLDMYSMGEMDIEAFYMRVKARDWYMLDLDAKPERRALVKWYMVQAARKSALVAWLHSLHKHWTQRQGLTAKVMRGEKDAKTEKWVRFVARQVEAFASMAKTYRFSLSFALLPFPSDVSGEQHTRRYRTQLQDIVTSRGFRFFDLQEPLRALYEQAGRLPVAPFDGHYNAAAHEAIALFLLESLREPNTLSEGSS
ncbi:MAG: hypothetical protein NPIRA02_14820 [Nitrospirales bacterium]|nr:MAG: hypothetical protein NPIRA02_14820 [Nitrospirales bacterium]